MEPSRRVPIVAGFVIAGLVAVFFLFAIIGSFKSMDPGHVGIIQEGGPLDGRGIAGIKAPGTGVENIGIFNDLRKFPSTTRNYIISADPSHGDRRGVDVFSTPTRDSVIVGIEGQALFRLNLDEAALEDFYRKFGVRTFNGMHPYDGDEGWAAFLDVQFRPVLENALREEIGKYSCAELNAACAIVKDVAGGDTSQNLAKIQQSIGETLQRDLEETLEGPFFVNVRFRLQQIALSDRLTSAVDEANAAKAQVQTERFRVQAAKEKAKAARELAKAYRSNPYAGAIEVVKNLPKDSTPILPLDLSGKPNVPGVNVRTGK